MWLWHICQVQTVHLDVVTEAFYTMNSQETSLFLVVLRIGFQVIRIYNRWLIVDEPVV